MDATLVQIQPVDIDLDRERDLMVQAYKTRFPDLVNVVEKSVEASFYQPDVKPVVINTILR